MTIESIRLPAAVVRWRLDVQPGPAGDVLVAGLIGAGCTAEVIAPGAAYRLDGDATLLQVLADQMVAEGIAEATLAREQADATVVHVASALAPKHAPRRSVTVHGAGLAAAQHVRMAVDAGLDVLSVGLQRWSVTGRTAALVQWLADAWIKPAADVLQVLALNDAAVVDEDTPAPPAPVVTVVLPDRKVTSVIDRDAEGNIINVTQRETTIQ